MIKNETKDRKVIIKQGGITLIALVITIIVLLILATVTISVLFEENGIIDRAIEAKLETKIKEIEEEANLIYSSKIIDNKSDVSFKDVITELENRGYKINEIVTNESKILGIELDKENYTLGTEEILDVKVRYIGDNESLNYYIEIDGKYYLISKENNRITISREEKEGIENSGNKIAVELSNEDCLKIEKVNGNIITLRSSSIVGNAIVTVTYGSYSKTCNVTVLNKPTSASKPDSNVTFPTSYGKIDVIWINVYNEVIKEPNTPNEILESGGEKLLPVIFNQETQEWDKVDIASKNWYDYTKKEWANAKTINDSYFVWIPRYAYRITYYENEESTNPTGYYDGIGMWRASDGALRYSIDKGIETIEYNGSKYIVHPAFETDLENGGWDKDLAGIWVGKFEVSGATGPDIQIIYGTQSTTSQPIGTQYLNARQATYGYKGIKGKDGNTSFMESHMMKNSEWGACAYLAHSKYGRDGEEITRNNKNLYRGGGTEKSYINNIDQSTTNNVYGIYGMTGGVWNRLAIFNSVDTGNYFSTYGWTEATGLTVESDSTKYATKYYNETNLTSGNAQVYAYGKIGDATKEVNNGGSEIGTSNRTFISWFSDSFGFVYAGAPFLDRGGNYLRGSLIGLFYGERSFGNGHECGSYRTVLCP